MTLNFKSVLGEEWFQTFSQFRLNPDTFFDKRKLTREAFCLDVLQDIYLDHIDVPCKICLLLLLQEHSLSLIKDINLLEQIVGSLVNLFDILKGSAENKLLKSQILVTVCTILLSSDIENDSDQLISSIRNLLLGIIFDGTENPVVLSTACQCLEEMEVCFPNILEDEIVKIRLSCEKHLSPAFQNYALLASLCVKNVCLKDSKIESGSDESDTFSFKKNQIQLPAVVSYLLELIPLMSHMCTYRVLSNLVPVVKHSSSISSVVFKLFVPILTFSSEVPYIHLAFDFLEAFQAELFNAHEEKLLLRQLILLSSHPCLTMSHRMLFLDWLKSCIVKQDMFSSTIPILPSLIPGPFDGPVTQEKKSCVIASCIPLNVAENLRIDFLNESISGLKKCALLPGGTKAASSFFRTLFVYLSLHNQEFMHNYLYKLLLEIMKTSPHLLQYELSFLDSVKIEFPGSTLPKKVLTHLVDHILSLPMKQFLGNLECYLAILEQASEVCGSECKPRSILRLLQTLLADLNSIKKNTWVFGNNILSVCLAILKFHDVQLFYYDLAEVLCLISQNAEDVDVKDRAKMYYCSLTTLSKLKVQSIFKMQSPKKDAQNPLTSFVPAANANLQFAPCVQVLTKPALQLLRIKKSWDALQEDSSTFQPISNIDIISVYKQNLKSSDFVVQIPFILKHVFNTEKSFETLYGVMISTQSSPTCKKISAVEIPVFKSAKSSDEDPIIYIDIVPYESQPIQFQFKAEFNCSNGFSYICYPDLVFLNFKDFFLELPIPSTLHQNKVSLRTQLFEILWSEFESKSRSKEICCCKSVFCLKTSKEKLSLMIDQEWKRFIVSRFDEYACWIAIFLPPKSHLLMKINLINEKPFISLVVDNISLLPWIALYLQELNC